MKKLIYAIASLALILTGCAKEINETGALDGDSVKVSVSTMLENAQPATKATWDNDGNAACVDHWIMEVYDAQGVLFDRQEKEGQSGLTNTFDVVLIKNQSYKFAFWADTKGMYETSDLRAVKTVSRKAGRDCRDAFFCEKDYKSTKSETLEAKLYRPFHQINIVTTDLDKIYKQMEKAGTQGDYAKFIPTGLKLKGETYNEFNVLTGDVSDVQEYELNIASCYADFMAHAAKSTIFMDYGFATEAKELKDLDFVFTSNGEEIAYNFTNIPLQRNYRTNILGNFMSNDAQWLVEIIPLWDGDGTTDEDGEDPYLVNYVKAGSIEAANQALAEGETNISIEDPEDAATHVVFPEEVTGKDVTINLTGAAGKTIYFENATVTKASGTTDGPANLTIIADEQSLNVNCPKTNVLINKGAGETDFPVIVAKSLKIEGEEGAVLKTGSSGKALRCESSLTNIEIVTDAANTGTDGALNVNKSSSFENVTFTGAAKYILVLGGENTEMSVIDCSFANDGKGRGIMVWGGSPVINVENTEFDNTYPFNVDGGSPVFNVEGSTLNGWTSYGGNTTASFKNCSFGKSTSGWAYCRPYTSTEFTGCDFCSDYRVDFGAAGITITMTDCTVEGTDPVTKAILESEPQAEGILIINGEKVYPPAPGEDPAVSDLPVEINWNEPSGCEVNGTTATISTDAETVVIPEGVTNINVEALDGNDNIRSLSLPTTVSNDANGIQVFGSQESQIGACDNLTDIYIEGGNHINFANESFVFGGGLKNIYFEKLPTSATEQNGVLALFYDFGDGQYEFSEPVINVYLPAGWVAAGYQYQFFVCPSTFPMSVPDVKVFEYDSESAKYVHIGTGTHDDTNGHGIWSPAN